MPAMDSTDEEFLQRVDGLFVGQLTPEELEEFDRLCQQGDACRSYEGLGGFMGLATVRAARLYVMRAT